MMVTPQVDPRRRHTVWGTVLGSFTLWLSVYGTNQAQVQRYLSVQKHSQVTVPFILQYKGLHYSIFTGC